MSERGSFVTNYIYCSECFNVCKKILLSKDKNLCSIVVPSWENGEELPIIAGKVGGMYAYEEVVIFANYYVPEIEKLICHPVQICVFTENGYHRVFLINSKKE